ncbi:MAG: acyl-ACP--UDP-N-acetylglucosamine O-acyltransferase [Alphaproteobacteria bacterium]|nr:MAG: acyl-ACP--UDP-N-acetylglucosamine O-acyltransferase [Alphaproteobacteria bacterium]
MTQSASLHPTAVVDPAARLGEGVEIGPYCCVGPHAELGANVRLISHVVIHGRTRIGEGTVVWPFASLGTPPQDLKYHGEESELIIGPRNSIREQVTMNPGTEGGGMVTRIGSDGLFMIGAHVAHDCQVGDHVIMANNASIAGHVCVGDHVILGGHAGVRQFVRIGAHAMIGGMSGVENDVIPFGLVMGERAALAGLNIVGLERRNFAREDIALLRRAYRALFAPEGTMNERLEAVERDFADHPLVGQVVAFMRERSGNALCQPRGSTNHG